MANQMNTGTLQMGEAWIDESGMTSLEPEGAGHHPHMIQEYPDIASQERWEDDFGGEPGGDEDDAIARGPKPVEGDGDGAPL